MRYRDWYDRSKNLSGYILGPAETTITDKLGRAIQADLDDATRQRFEEDRRRLDGWRYTLGEMARAESESGITQSAVPRRRALRQQRGA